MAGVTRTLTMMVFGFRLRSGPFEGPASVKPPALPEAIYFPQLAREDRSRACAGVNLVLVFSKKTV